MPTLSGLGIRSFAHIVQIKLTTEQFAQIALDKWANRSGCSEEMSEWGITQKNLPKKISTCSFKV